MGDTTKLPAATQKAVKGAIDETSECNGMVLNFALNYGGRDEIVTAVQQVAQLVKDDQLKVEQIDESVIAEHLMTNQLGEFEDPELIIRTSGEQRVSNFMLWQLAIVNLSLCQNTG